MLRKRRVFTLLISVILCLTMAVPVSAGTSYSQRYNAAQKMFNAIYFGKYKGQYNYGTDYKYSYDLDINKDGWPEHIDHYFNREIVVIYTSYKNTVRRYVFKNANEFRLYRYKNYLIMESLKLNADGSVANVIDKHYTIKKGKLSENKKLRLRMKEMYNENGDEITYYWKNNKRISEIAYNKNWNKHKLVKSSSYWSKLFNATRNFN